MGLLDRFRGRREAEDALAQAGAEGSQAAEPEAAENVPIPGIGGIPELQELISQAANQGQLHIDADRMQMAMPGLGAMGMPAIDLRSHPEKREVVFEILRRHGIDARGGEAVRVTDPRIQAEIMQALQRPPEQPPAS